MPQDLDADTFLRDLIEEYEAFAAQANVRLVSLFGTMNRTLRADPDRLKQVVGNVVSNAVKFSPQGGQVECSAQLSGAHLRIAVRDHGIGIPEGKEDQVFGRFNQVESGTKKVSGGSGLGMHIAKILIERMGGAVRYESRLGEGTTFYIDVPLADPEGQPDPTV